MGGKEEHGVRTRAPPYSLTNQGWWIVAHRWLRKSSRALCRRGVHSNCEDQLGVFNARRPTVFVIADIQPFGPYRLLENPGV